MRGRASPFSLVIDGEMGPKKHSREIPGGAMTYRTAAAAAAPVIQPEGAEAGTCRSCDASIWWVYTTGGQPMPLDTEPDLRNNDVVGNIEMVRVGGEWRAEQLAQTECLFEVERERWRSHFATCPHATKWRSPPLPRQRRGQA